MGVRKNQGKNSTATRCSTSRKKTVAVDTSQPTPSARQRNARNIGTARNIEKSTAGTRINAVGTTTANITSDASACESTTEVGMISRGKRTLRIRFALATIEPAASWVAAWKNVQTANPLRMNSG